MDKDNAAQDLAENLLTDPDRDAGGAPKPLPPQTTDAEPTSGRPGQHRVADDDDED